jgi:hypothetical protein
VDENGAIGAIFGLSKDSPLPRWCLLPPGVTRDQVEVKITEYEATTSPKWKVRFQVRDRSGKILYDKIGLARWRSDSERKRAPAATYPNWIVIEVDNTKEDYEQSGPDDLLKIVTRARQ